jgi:hypothetical protein
MKELLVVSLDGSTIEKREIDCSSNVNKAFDLAELLGKILLLEDDEQKKLFDIVESYNKNKAQE